LTTRNYDLMKWIGFAVIIALIDQITKYLATANLVYGDPHALIPGINLTLFHNTGAAFSFLADQGGWQRWFFAILTTMVSLGLIVWLKFLSHEERATRIAICLILGGAIGNLFDRLTWGYVIDFIQLYYSSWYWPIFNVADASITIGAVLLIFAGSHFEKAT